MLRLALTLLKQLKYEYNYSTRIVNVNHRTVGEVRGPELSAPLYIQETALWRGARGGDIPLQLQRLVGVGGGFLCMCLREFILDER